MSHEFYRPSKESRDIRRDQERHSQGQEVRLGFLRSYTETAKPGDTLRRMIKRAYKDGKLYSDRQANEAADRVIALLGTKNITRVKHGDRITFRNDAIIFRFFEPQNDGPRDREFRLEESEGSLNHQRRVIVTASGAQRATLAEGPAEDVAKPAETPTARPEPSPEQLLAQQRREVIRAFINNTENLKSVISNGQPETVTAIASRRITSPDSRIPTQFRAYEFSEIISSIKNAIDPTHYLIGLNPQTGEVVLFKTSDRSTVARVRLNGSSDLAILRSALRIIANPS